MYQTADPAMAARLRQLLDATPGLEAAALVSVDGLPMASAEMDESQVERLAAMSAAVLSLGERLAMDFERGALDQVVILGERGWLVLASAGGQAVLAALLSLNADETHALEAIRQAARDLGDRLR